MGPESILLSVKQNGREGSYRFTCPNCADAVEKRADRKIVILAGGEANEQFIQPLRLTGGVQFQCFRTSGTRDGLVEDQRLQDRFGNGAEIELVFLNQRER